MTILKGSKSWSLTCCRQVGKPRSMSFVRSTESRRWHCFLDVWGFPCRTNLQLPFLNF